MFNLMLLLFLLLTLARCFVNLLAVAATSKRIQDAIDYSAMLPLGEQSAYLEKVSRALYQWRAESLFVQFFDLTRWTPRALSPAGLDLLPPGVRMKS